MLGQKSTVEINQHIQRHREIMGLELGLIQKQKHTVHQNTQTHRHSAWLGTKSAHRLIFIFAAHIVRDIQYQETKNIITPPVCNLAVNPMPESNK